MTDDSGKKKILVVDDEDDIREVIQVSIESLTNWNVIVARNGHEGISMAEAESPDAILLDVMMPGMDGPTTLSKLKSNPKTRGIPVILLTAKVRTNEVQQFEGLEAESIISKPFDPMVLSTSIAKVLKWKMEEKVESQ